MVREFTRFIIEFEDTKKSFNLTFPEICSNIEEARNQS